MGSYNLETCKVSYSPHSSLGRGGDKLRRLYLQKNELVGRGDSSSGKGVGRGLQTFEEE